MNKGPVVAVKTPSWQVRPKQFRDHPEGNQPGIPEVFLHPGQIHVAASPVVLKMILGSCVGVFLFDSTLGLGGATHFMLPWHGTSPPSPRYGDVAMAGLLQKFQVMGSKLWNIEAKVFGGACILAALQDIGGHHVGHIGERNVSCALEILTKEHIPVVARHLLGNCGRKVSIISPTGETTLELLNNTDGNR